MLDRQRALERAVTNALEQVRAELLRMYADGDIGTVVVHVGKQQMQIKANPERRRDPVQVDSK